VLDVVRLSRPTTAEMPDATLLGSLGATDADHPIAPDGSRYFTRFVCKERSTTPALALTGKSRRSAGRAPTWKPRARSEDSSRFTVTMEGEKSLSKAEALR
jgi:hypothetical protein